MGYPLGKFDPNAPLDQDALDAAKALVAAHTTELDACKGKISRLYLHWAVAPFGCTFTDYNLMVNFVDGKWVDQWTHDLRDNVAGLNGNAEASHTWERNTNACGIAIGGMDGASVYSFGPDGVQLHELEYLCALAAAVAHAVGLDTAGVVAAPGETHPSNNDGTQPPNTPPTVNTTGEHTILTHGECAVIDAYPTERWDLGELVPAASGQTLTPAIRSQSGDALRARVHLYAAAL